MKLKISELLAQITVLEDELRIALREQESKLSYRIKGKRVEFETTVRIAHQKLKQSIFHWIVADRPQNLLTCPFIYSLIVPLAFLDLSVTLYQAICFPVYKISKVKRGDYIVLDRQQLAYLNGVERFHCSYCAYANGLLAYTTEIAARTEQYFCPIKHARRVLGTHDRYRYFLAFGDAIDYHARLEEFRCKLKEKPERDDQTIPLNDGE